MRMIRSKKSWHEKQKAILIHVLMNRKVVVVVVVGKISFQACIIFATDRKRERSDSGTNTAKYIFADASQWPRKIRIYFDTPIQVSSNTYCTH